MAPAKKKGKAKAIAKGKAIKPPPSPAPTPAEQPAPGAASKNLLLDLQKSLTSRLKPIGGSRAEEWNEIIASQAFKTLWKTGREDDDVRNEHGVLLALICMKPQDEFEGMLAAQMIGAHNAAMECYRRAMLAEQSFAGRQEALNQANKLSRTYTALLEAMNRHRGKGQQKVTVEHVHVHSGGQAIVGNVEAPGTGGAQDSGKSTPCCWTCRTPPVVERGTGAGSPASPRQCLMAAVGCTAARRLGLQRAIRTPSRMGATRPRQLPAGEKYRHWCGRQENCSELA